MMILPGDMVASVHVLTDRHGTKTQRWYSYAPTDANDHWCLTVSSSSIDAGALVVACSQASLLTVLVEGRLLVVSVGNVMDVGR